jgi:hypothetical protein
MRVNHIFTEDPNRSPKLYDIESRSTFTFSLIGIMYGDQLDKDWTLMPDNREILITHTFAHSEFDMIWCDFVFVDTLIQDSPQNQNQ